jgi:L-rhamnose mutarotase
MALKRYCFALDLKNEISSIKEYEAYHKHVWPEIIESIKSSGIEVLDIYRIENRLFMIMETTNDFNLDDKAAADASNPRVQEWETLMWRYQQALPSAKPGEKWMLMQKIFQLD